MEKMLRFSLHEYRQRLTRIKAEMEKREIDVLCDADPSNMYYTTGFEAMSYFIPQMMVISADHDEPLIFTRKMDTFAVSRTAYIAEKNIFGWPEDMTQHRTRNPMHYVAAELEKRGWTNRRIGIDNDAWFFTPRDRDALLEGLGDAKCVDASLLINGVRGVKSERELDYMRQAARIQEKVFATVYDTAAEGVRECDLIGEVYRAQMRGTDEFGGDYSACQPFMPTGDKMGSPHLSWTAQPLKGESGFTIELGAVRHRYHAPLARTVYLGKNPPKQLLDAEQSVLEGMEATLSNIKAGMTAHEANAPWQAFNEAHGLEKDSRIGYAIGIGYPPVWQEKTISIRDDEGAILEENMTFHMVFGLWHDSWGFFVSESIRIARDGVEILCDVPRDLFVKG